MRSLKKLNQAAGTSYTRWDQAVRDIREYHAPPLICERCGFQSDQITFYEHDVMQLCDGCKAKAAKGTEWDD